MSAKQSKGSAVGQEAFDTVVIGGGQAGLAAGYFLAQRGANFIILDKDHIAQPYWAKLFRFNRGLQIQRQACDHRHRTISIT
jgi:cation diffusion facilitator CzcD-associated flavoprotein CzcO